MSMDAKAYIELDKAKFMISVTVRCVCSVGVACGVLSRCIFIFVISDHYTITPPLTLHTRYLHTIDSYTL